MKFLPAPKMTLLEFRQRWVDVIQAVQAGHSYVAVAKACGVSSSRVQAIMKRAELWRPRQKSHKPAKPAA